MRKGCENGEIKGEEIEEKFRNRRGKDNDRKRYWHVEIRKGDWENINERVHKVIIEKKKKRLLSTKERNWCDKRNKGFLTYLEKSWKERRKDRNNRDNLQKRSRKISISLHKCILHCTVQINKRYSRLTCRVLSSVWYYRCIINEISLKGEIIEL